MPTGTEEWLTGTKRNRNHFWVWPSYYREFVPMFFEGTALLAELTKTTVHGE